MSRRDFCPSSTRSRKVLAFLELSRGRAAYCFPLLIGALAVSFDDRALASDIADVMFPTAPGAGALRQRAIECVSSRVKQMQEEGTEVRKVSIKTSAHRDLAHLKSHRIYSPSSSLPNTPVVPPTLPKR